MSTLFSLQKGTFPFKLGTTSYIIPDDIIPNAQVLAPIVDDIELVLFESPEISNIPSHKDIQTLHHLGEEHGCGYTIHLPTTHKAGSSSESERIQFCDDTKKIIDRCTPLTPHGWILHLEGIGHTASADEVARWREYCHEVVRVIVPSFQSPQQLTIENLNYPWQWHKELVSEHHLSYCCDVGHFWVQNIDNWMDQVEALLPETKVIHLHGVHNTEDHVSLQKSPGEKIRTLCRILNQMHYSEVITLEIFNEKDFIESKEIFTQLWEQSVSSPAV